MLLLCLMVRILKAFNVDGITTGGVVFDELTVGNDVVRVMR